MRSFKTLLFALPALALVITGSIFGAQVARGAGIPVISTVSPATGYKTGGDTITISGSNFESDARVYIGGNQSPSVLYIDESTLVATTPAGYLGPTDITVRSIDEQEAVSINGFTYIEPTLSLTSLSPSAGPAQGGQTVYLNGSNLSSGLLYVTGVSVDALASGVSSCGVYNNYKAYCWGYNGFGQLGNGSTTSTSTPGPVSVSGALADKSVRSIAGGSGHRCAVTSEEKVYCWGRNNSGQVGNNSTTTVTSPVAVDTTGVLAGKSIRKVVAGAETSCVLTSDGMAFCWGKNSNGQLGNNSTSSSSTPVAVDMAGALAGKTLKDISLKYNTVCAVTTEGLAYCWGAGGGGQIGNNTLTATNSTPTAVTASGVLQGVRVSSVSAGSNHVCALSLEGAMYCWGQNNFGQMGNNTSTVSRVPTAVITTTMSAPIVKMSAGGDTTCAITIEGVVYCWGLGSDGQLGINTTAISRVPVAVNTTGVLNGKSIQSVDVGNASVCAVASDEQLYCWGQGSPGNGTGSGARVPVATNQVTQGAPAVTIGGVSATNVVLNSSSQLQFRTPARTGGVVSVNYTQYDTQSGSLTNAYEYVSAPQLSSISPNTGYIEGGNEVTLTGANFYEGMTVTIGGVAATNVQVVSSTVIKATAPASTTPGAKSVVVSDPYGQSQQLTNAYSYRLTTPTLTSVNPSARAYTSGTTVTIKGAGFYDWGAGSPWYTAVFKSAPATNLTFIDSTTLTATLPSNTAGITTVELRSSYADTATLPNGFTYLANGYEFSNASLSVAATEPGKLTIRSLNASGNPVTSSSNTLISLSSSSPQGEFAVNLSEDELTRWSHTSVVLPANTSSVDVWYKDASPGTPALTGSVADGAMTFSQTATIASPYKFEVSGVSDPIQSGVPSSITVRVVDYNGAPLRDYEGTLSFSSNDTEASLPQNYTMKASDRGIKTFVNGVTMKTPGEFCVTATDMLESSITGSQCDVSVRAALTGDISQLAIITPVQSIPTDASSAPITIQTQDSQGNALPVQNQTPLYITSNSSTALFSIDGTTWTSADDIHITMPSGMSSLNLYIKDSQSGDVSISVKDLQTDSGAPGGQGDTGWRNASQSLRFGVGVADRVYIEGVDTLLVNQKGSYTIELRDAQGNTVTALSDYRIVVETSSLSAQLFGAGEVNPSGGQIEVQIPTGHSGATFEMRDSTASVGTSMTTLEARDYYEDASRLLSAEKEVQILAARLATSGISFDTLPLKAGEPTELAVSLYDEAGQKTYASEEMTLQLQSSSATGRFSLTSSPFVPITSVTVQRGEGEKHLYYRETIVGSSQLRAAHASLTAQSTTAATVSSDIFRLGISPASATAELDKSSSAYTVTAYDVYGNVSIVDHDTSVYLSADIPTISFSSDTQGPWTEQEVLLTAGQSTTQFYARGSAFTDTPARIIVSDQNDQSQGDTGIADTSATLQVVSQQVASIVYTTQQRTASAGTLSDEITFELRQADGSLAVQNGATSVSLSIQEGKIVSQQQADAQSISSITIPRGEAGGTVYYYGEKSGEYSVRAQIGSRSSTQAVTVNAGAPSRAEYTSPEQSLTVGQASEPLSVRIVDAFGNLTAFDTETTVQLSASCDGEFSLSASSWHSISTITLNEGVSTFQYYFKGFQADSCELSATLEGITAARQTIEIASLNTDPFRLRMSGPGEIIKGAEAIYSVSILDVSGNVVPANTATTITLESSSQEGDLSQPNLRFEIGDTTKTFTYSADKIHEAEITATDQVGVLEFAAYSIRVVDGEPSRLSIAPSASTARAGERTAMVIEVQNEYGLEVNAAEAISVTLTSQSGGQFYADASNETPLSSTEITANTGSATVYYAQTTTGNAQVSARATDLTTGNATISILPASIQGASFINQPYIDDTALEIGEEGVFEVALIDAYGNRAIATSTITLYARSSASGSFRDGGVVTIEAGRSNARLYYTQEVTGDFELTVSDSVSGSGGVIGEILQEGQVVYGEADTVRFKNSELSLERGAVSEALTVELLNSSGKVVPAPVNGKSVSFAMREGTGQFSLSQNGAFTNSLSGTIPEGESEMRVYYRNDAALIENRQCSEQGGERHCSTLSRYEHTIVAQTQGTEGFVRSDTLEATMLYGAPVRYTFITPERQQITNKATAAITIERQNRYGLPVPLHRDSTLSLASSADATGSFGRSKVQWFNETIIIRDSEASTSFYYKDSQSGTPLLSVQPTGAEAQDEIAGDEQAVTILNGPATPPPATDLIVTNISDPQQQGTASSVIVIAVDEDGFIVDSYDGRITFSSDDDTAILPEGYTFNPLRDRGSKTFTNSVAFRTPGEKSVTATDTDGRTGSQQNITVLGANTNPVSEIRFTQPTSPYQMVRQTSPLPLLIELFDQHGERTVAPAGGLSLKLTTTSASALFKANEYTNAASSIVVSVPAGVSFASVLYEVADVKSHTLTVTDWNGGIDQLSIKNGSLSMRGDDSGTNPVDPSLPIVPATPTQPGISKPTPTVEVNESPSIEEDVVITPEFPSENTATEPHQPSGTPDGSSHGEQASSADVVLTSSILAAGTLLVIIPLIGESIRHVRNIHALQQSARKYHVAVGLLESESITRPIVHSPYASGFFWAPIVASIVISAAVTVALQHVIAGQVGAVGASLIAVASLLLGSGIFVGVHTKYLTLTKAAFSNLLLRFRP